MNRDELRTIVLRDGRTLAYGEFGDLAGRPWLYFHGFPGSRLEGRLIDGIAAQYGVRIVAVDRPGFGASDFRPGRTLLDWPDDVTELADALGLQRFAVVGVSGGGPYACACAYRMAGRLTAAAVLSGLGPVEDPGTLDGMLVTNRLGLLAARSAPWLSLPAFALATPVVRRGAEHLIHRLASRVSPRDREFFARPENFRVFVETLREAFRQGPRGPAHDVRLYSRPWGFDLEDIRIPVCLWHGDRDVVVPVAMGRHVASRIPACMATFHPDDGHFSVVADHVTEVFSTILTLSD